jgi:hypothetical protein
MITLNGRQRRTNRPSATARLRDDGASADVGRLRRLARIARTSPVEVPGIRRSRGLQKPSWRPRPATPLLRKKAMRVMKMIRYSVIKWYWTACWPISIEISSLKSFGFRNSFPLSLQPSPRCRHRVSNYVVADLAHRLNGFLGTLCSDRCHLAKSRSAR